MEEEGRKVDPRDDPPRYRSSPITADVDEIYSRDTRAGSRLIRRGVSTPREDRSCSSLTHFFLGREDGLLTKYRNVMWKRRKLLARIWLILTFVLFPRFIWLASLNSYPYLVKDRSQVNSEELLQAGKIPEKLQPVISLIIILQETLVVIGFRRNRIY